jgi:hypothetical protein
MVITPLATFSINSSANSRAERLSSAASNTTVEDDDWVPDVKELKLGLRCVGCSNAKTKCVPLDNNVTNSICSRCFNGGYTCNYAFLKPNLIEKCDECVTGKRVCQKPAPRPKCSPRGSRPCVHEACNRCKEIGKPCNWEGARRSKALTSLWQRTDPVPAITEGSSEFAGYAPSGRPRSSLARGQACESCRGKRKKCTHFDPSRSKGSSTAVENNTDEQ